MRIRFTLPRSQRILLTLRGPAPSCRSVGTVRIRGNRGVNRLDFFGRVGRKAVRPGVYVLSLTRASSRQQVARPLLVQVVSNRRTILLRSARARAGTCDFATESVARTRLATLISNLARPVTSLDPSSRQTPASPASTPRAAKPKTTLQPRPEPDTVLGVEVDLPALPQPEGWQPWALVVVLLLVCLPMLALMAFVVRFLRGSWNP